MKKLFRARWDWIDADIARVKAEVRLQKAQDELAAANKLEDSLFSKVQRLKKKSSR